MFPLIPGSTSLVDSLGLQPVPVPTPVSEAFNLHHHSHNSNSSSKSDLFPLTDYISLLVMYAS